jgi:hypothetical protein
MRSEEHPSGRAFVELHRTRELAAPVTVVLSSLAKISAAWEQLRELPTSSPLPLGQLGAD